MRKQHGAGTIAFPISIASLAGIRLTGFSLPIWYARLNNDDYRYQSLEKRQASLEKLPPRTTGLRLSEHLEGEGPLIFKRACKMGLGGIVSKRRDRPCRSGRVSCWIKVKIPYSPAMARIEEATR
jgi:hypothetical protein